MSAPSPALGTDHAAQCKFGTMLTNAWSCSQETLVCCFPPFLQPCCDPAPAFHSAHLLTHLLWFTLGLPLSVCVCLCLPLGLSLCRSLSLSSSLPLSFFPPMASSKCSHILQHVPRICEQPFLTMKLQELSGRPKPGHGNEPSRTLDRGRWPQGNPPVSASSSVSSSASSELSSGTPLSCG